MGNEVYANGREVACKAADGKSICAFPDVCLTRPDTGYPTRGTHPLPEYWIGLGHHGWQQKCEDLRQGSHAEEQILL